MTILESLLPDGGKIQTEGTPIAQVIDAINRRFRARPESDDLHYCSFTDMTRYDISAGKISSIWPYGPWIACFPVKGSNEGYYVHIEAIERNGRNQLLALCKVENEDPLLAARIASLAFFLLEA